MGLDGVELVLATEDEFKIVIDDADAANITTPRMLADYVIICLGMIGNNKSGCLSQAGFYRLRSVLVKQFGALRNDVRLDSPIQQFLKGNIRTQWQQLRIAIDATQLPHLQCKKHIYYLTTIVVPVLLVIMLHWMGSPFWATFMVFIGLWIGANIATDKLSNLVPSTVATIRELVPYVGIADPQEWSYEFVLQRVIQITSVQLGIPVEKIHPDHHFVKDLGLG